MSDGKAATADETQANVGVERRKSLPQPDFAPYKKANAYPGPAYFFVGHSYDVELDKANDAAKATRSTAIGTLFSKDNQWVPVQEALKNERFGTVLTRFEHDLLHRLPETALIGTAIDPSGKVISQSFTIWREERRKPRA